jgi:hypothetical protein
VVGVLAILSLLAATFGMVMTTERAATRNQTEFELARQAALAGYEYVLATLRDVGAPSLQTSGPILLDPDIYPDSQYGSKLVAHRNGLKIYFMTSAPQTPRDVPLHRELFGKEWATGVGATKTGVFPINAMGQLGDLGSDSLNEGTRISSFEVSLVRLLEDRFDPAINDGNPGNGEGIDDSDIDNYCNNFTTDPAVRRDIARLLASAVLARRYGGDGLPGRRALNDSRLDHVLPHYTWLPGMAADTGASLVKEWGIVASATATTLTDDTATWTTDAFLNNDLLVHSAGAWRQIPTIPTITTNSADTLTVAAFDPTPAAGDKYAILAADTLGNGDDAPTAVLGPNGVLSCEDNVARRWVDEGTLTAVDAVSNPQTVTVSRDWNAGTAGLLNATGMVIRLLDGDGAGQVRMISAHDTTTNTLTLLNPWTTAPAVGSAYRIEFDGLLRGQVEDIATLDSLTDTGAFDLDPAANDEFKGCVVNIYNSSVADAVGQTRLIVSNTADTLTLARNWTQKPPDPTDAVPGQSWYRIEMPQDYKYRPDSPQGDDRIYRSVPEVLPVMNRALQEYPLLVDFDGDMDLADDAAKAGAILFSGIKDSLTIAHDAVSKRAEYASINDPATDGIDNDHDGVVDNEDMDWNDDGVVDADDWKAYAEYFYLHSGLNEWVNAKGADLNARRAQALQLIANIIDYRDADHVPTRLTADALGGDAADFTYGYEGVRITEIMGTPPSFGEALTGNDEGTELIDDGNGPTTGAGLYDNVNPDTYNNPLSPVWIPLKDGHYQDPLLNSPTPGWDFYDGSPGYWILKEAAQVTGKWSFDRAQMGAKRGWYALRLRATAGEDFNFTTSDGRSGKVRTGSDIGDGTGWGYVRRDDGNWPNSPLLTVEVTSSDTLVFELQPAAIPAADEITFHEVQLLPQFFEVTSAAGTDAVIDELRIMAHDPNDASAAPSQKTVSLPDTPRIQGVLADGHYPIKYRTFVLAMSEYAFDYQFGNADGVWGTVPGEDPAAVFVGDLGSSGAARYANADRFLIPRAEPQVELRYDNATLAKTGNGEIDGYVGTCPAYVSREKPYWPFYRTTSGVNAWSDYNAAGEVLNATTSKNSGSLDFGYTGLNASYLDPDMVTETIWDDPAGYPTIETDDTVFKGLNRVWPIIRNRPYPSAGWLGLVPVGDYDTDGDGISDAGFWRTIDPEDPTDVDDPATPDIDESVAATVPKELLGTLLERCTSGGVHGRINLNFPNDDGQLETALKTIFTDADAAAIAAASPWTNWDDALNDAVFTGLYSGNGANDTGAGLLADDFDDDTDEKEEWARRYINLLGMQANEFKYVIAGFVYGENAAVGEAPLAEVRIEAEFDITSNPVTVKNFRYITE